MGTAHVVEAHNEMFCSPKILGIRSCSRHEQFFLRAVVHCFQKTGLEETTFDRVFGVVTELAAVEGAARIHSAQVLIVVECKLHCQKAGLGFCFANLFVV